MRNEIGLHSQGKLALKVGQPGVIVKSYSPNKAQYFAIWNCRLVKEKAFLSQRSNLFEPLSAGVVLRCCNLALFVPVQPGNWALSGRKEIQPIRQRQKHFLALLGVGSTGGWGVPDHTCWLHHDLINQQHHLA